MGSCREDGVLSTRSTRSTRLKEALSDGVKGEVVVGSCSCREGSRVEVEIV